WREEWLRPIEEGSKPVETSDASGHRLESLSAASTRPPGRADVYRCQATEAPRASEPMSRYDLRQYVREGTARNFGPVQVVRILVRGAWTRTLEALGRGGMPRAADAQELGPSRAILPGDLVRVRSREEIAATLDSESKNRGLFYDDAEMSMYCGGTFRVKS